jgi:ecotin
MSDILGVRLVEEGETSARNREDKPMTPRLILAALAAVATLTATAAASLAGSAPDATVAASESSLSNLEHYPASMKEHRRFVLHLPNRENESDFKVEVIAGLQREWSCNRPWLTTDTKARDVKGWGFDYYVVSWNGKFASTLMACLPETKETTFVHGSGKLIDYNSKLPVVVFVPKDLSVRYRIWNAGTEQEMDTSSTIGTAEAAEADLPEGEGGRLSVQSTQTKGTKVIRKKDKYGNRIDFTQSD